MIEVNCDCQTGCFRCDGRSYYNKMVEPGEHFDFERDPVLLRKTSKQSFKEAMTKAVKEVEKKFPLTPHTKTHECKEQAYPNKPSTPHLSPGNVPYRKRTAPARLSEPQDVTHKSESPNKP